MGMAASQARFLGLTARKSNVEFQGQQINQARTALTNEVMGLYGQYAKLDVPVAPSKYDYVKTTYSIDSTYENYQLKDFTKITKGDYAGYYSVTLTCDEEIPKAYNEKFKDTVLTVKQDEEGNFNYLHFVIGTNMYTYDAANEKESSLKKITGDYSQYPGLSTIMKNQGLDPADPELNKTYYCFTKDSQSYYVSEDDLKLVDFEKQEDKSMYYGDFTFDYQGIFHKDKEVQAIAALTQDSRGRLTAINVLKCEDDKDLEDKAYSVKVGSDSDEDGYLDAMNKYNYEKDKYEKRVKELNAKIEKIQTEDKALEIKLAQLDTEQEALKTEMDAISQTITDTIDKLFDSSK